MCLAKTRLATLRLTLSNNIIFTARGKAIRGWAMKGLAKSRERLPARRKS